MSGLSRVPLGSSASIARLQSQSIRPINPVVTPPSTYDPYPSYPSYPSQPYSPGYPPSYPPSYGGSPWRFNFWRGVELTGRGLLETLGATGELLWRVAGVALRGLGAVFSGLWRGVQAIFDPGYQPNRPYPGQRPY